MAHPKQAITAKDWLLLSLFFLLVIAEVTYILGQLQKGVNLP
jgi:hypothetical protein